MATFHKRGDGQIECQVRRKGYAPQRRTFSTKADALAWAMDIESRMMAGTYRETGSAREMPLTALIERYKREIAPKQKDSKGAIQICNALIAEFQHEGVTTLSPARITRYRNALSEAGYAASTINHHINKLSAIYTAAEKEFHMALPANPAKSVTRITPPPGRKQRVPPFIVRKLIEANVRSNKTRKDLGGQEPFGEFKAFLMLALRTAMRRGEIANLLWSQINFKDRTAFVADSKNGESRTVPLSRHAIRILKTLWAKRDEDQERVFKLTIEGFKSAWRRAREGVAEEYPEVMNIRFHDTRREATSRLAKKLPNVVELSKVTGHKKLEMLAVYYEPTPTELADKLDA